MTAETLNEQGEWAMQAAGGRAFKEGRTRVKVPGNITQKEARAAAAE